MNPDILNTTVDKTQIPPLHQKRILAFVNHFVISSCSFLNDFALKCESKFIEVERKIQKVEASLIIIEAKLASVPETSEIGKKIESNVSEPKKDEVVLEEKLPPTAEDQGTDVVDVTPPQEARVKASEDARYKKFFKMLQFGVPIGAVKLKMQAEGVNPTLIDNPNLIIPDGVLDELSC